MVTDNMVMLETRQALSIGFIAGDLEDSKSTSGGILCIFGSRTFVSVSWMRKKANISSVSHSSREFEATSLGAGLRMDGILENTHQAVKNHCRIEKVDDQDPKIHIKFVDTKNQLADMLTEGNFTRDK